MENFSEQLKKRTKVSALQIIKLCQTIPYNSVNSVLVRQLTKSGTSVAANYRAATRGRSDAEFYSKICIVVEEADETLFWLEMLLEAGIVIPSDIQPIFNESEEILKIMVTIKNKTLQKLNKKP
jgi:four helix bundle protein